MASRSATESGERFLTIFDPNHPIRGMRSAVVPSALPLGTAAQVYNLRTDKHALYVRDGHKKVASPPFAGAVLKGAWVGQLQSSGASPNAPALFIFAAYWDGAETRIYVTDPTSWTWTEATNGTAGSKNADTRFSNANKVQFTTVRDPVSQRDLLIAENGYDVPKVYDPLAASGSRMANHNPVTIPDPSHSSQVQLSMSDFVHLWQGGTRDPSNLAYSTSATSVAITGGGGSISNAAPPVVVTPAAHGLASGDQVVIKANFASRYVHIVCNVTVVNPTTFQITGYDSTNWGAWGGTTGTIYKNGLSFGDTGSFVASGTTLQTAISVPTSIAANSTATLDWGVGAFQAINFSASKQLVMHLSSPGGMTVPEFVNSVKVELGNGATYVTVYDPTTSPVDPVIVDAGADPLASQSLYVAVMAQTSGGSTSTDAPRVYTVGYSLDGIDTTSLAVTTAYKLRLTWQPSTGPNSRQIVTVYGIQASGNVAGGASYGFSWSNAASRAESYGTVISAYSTKALAKIGACPAQSLNVPNSSILYYKVTLTTTNVAAGEIQKGTDTLNVYRRDVGENRHTFVSSTVVNTYTAGAWVTTNAGTVVTISDTLSAANKNQARVMPDAYHLPIPIGTSVRQAGSRLFVGGSGPSNSELWVSEENNPFKFRRIVRFLDATNPDPASPTMVVFPSEIVSAIASIGGALIGVDPIIVFTYGNCYRFDGFDSRSLSRPTRVGRHGCPYQNAITERFGRLYWIDNERQVRVMRGSDIKSITKLRVDDRLKSGDLANASIATKKDRVYISYTPSGHTIVNGTLVYEEQFDEWVEDEMAVGECAQFLTIDSALDRKIFALGGSLGTGLGQADVYEYEKAGQTTDEGVAITATLVTPELHDHMWNQLFFGAVGLVADNVAGTVTVERTWRPSGTTGADGSINLASYTGATAWLWEHCSGGLSPGGGGLSCRVRVSGALPSGTSFYSMVMRTKPSQYSGAIQGG